MAGRLKDKVAIVTGAASGIGRETVLRFVQEGARVVVADRNRAGGMETQRMARELGSDVVYTPVDVSKADEVRDMVESAVAGFGRLDVLVNAAAILIRTPPLADVDERDWDLIMSTNLKGLFFCCKYAIPAMLHGGGGSIVNIASQAGIRGYGYSLPYAVSKAGVIHLTTVTASQYTSQGIRVNVIAPGPVDTPQMRGSTASTEVFEERWPDILCIESPGRRRFPTSFFSWPQTKRPLSVGVPSSLTVVRGRRHADEHVGHVIWNL